MNEVSALIKENRGPPSPLPPQEGTVRRHSL